uniref:U22-theraphotoxin-Cg1a n=1 Tax=Chilobrachys guangxiensis TaxID=278060 RepID=JZT44_CHIGU|nr:RecName: Full=U22-theraphotoxin-Cg1a; Short=U22-TRTX-Cg1a; AltName: Full=Jingzhaotoxin-44; Short=JZTX-44; AltName: Full=Peptide F6-26.48; Flags: Precursor [Chilobrachys guangxiensis]ABY71718.1 cystine knot toxin [Chilobrachys guangxiensis]
MKVSVVLAITVLALLSVAYASEFEEKELVKEVVRTIFLGKEDAALREETDRECKWYLGDCKAHEDCCEHLRCHSRWDWCIWDGTFG